MKWNKCSECLPEVYETVLIYKTAERSNHRTVTTDFVNECGQWSGKNQPTHWMRFPEPPSSDGDNPLETNCWHCFGDGVVDVFGIEERWEERCVYCNNWEKRNEL